MQNQTSDSSQPYTADDHNGEIYASIDESVIGNEDKVTADSATYDTGKHCVLWIVRLYIWGKKNNREYDIDRTCTGYAINFSGDWQYRSRVVQISPTWNSKWTGGSILVSIPLLHEDLPGFGHRYCIFFCFYVILFWPTSSFTHYSDDSIRNILAVHLRIIYHYDDKMYWHLVGCLYVYFLLFYDATFERKKKILSQGFLGPQVMHVVTKARAGNSEGLVRNCSYSIANALELLESCAKPSICCVYLRTTSCYLMCFCSK